MNFENAAGLRERLPHISSWDRFWIRNMGVKMFVGKERREGWRGELPFYVFWCDECEDFSYDYPHGHIERQHLNCYLCGLRIDFRPWWIELKMAWEFLKALLWGR